MAHPGQNLGDIPPTLRWMQSGGQAYHPSALSVYEPTDRGRVSQAPLPPEAEVIKQGMEAALSSQNAITSSEAVPWQLPPRRAIPFNQTLTVLGTPGLVLTVAAGVDATTFASAGEVALALGPAWTGNPLVVAGIGANDFTPVVAFLVPFGFLVAVKQIGVFTRSLQGWEDLRWRMRIRGIDETGAPTGAGTIIMPDTFFKIGEPDSPADIFAIATQSQVVSLEVRMTVSTTPYVVEGRVSGWAWPVEKQSDSDRDTVLRPSRGLQQ